jgi:mevalonate kinase
MSVGSGHGKAIVAGEHHVLHGATALAVALPGFTTTVTLTALSGDRLAVDGDELARPLVQRACELAGVTRPVRASVLSTVPVSRGLGSSAALAVAAVRAAEQLSGLPCDQVAAAREVECLVHGRSSGLDPAAAAATGAVLYANGQVVRPVACHPALAEARWLLLDLGPGRPTREAIAAADRQRTTLGPAVVDALQAETTRAALQAAEALESGDLTRLAGAMTAAGEALDPLGVVDEAMRRVLALARQAGTLAVKQTGAGLGGVLLGLAASHGEALRLQALLTPHVREIWLAPLASPPTEAP